MNAKTFGDRLRRLRERAGLSRAELAAKAGFRSQAGIRDIEQGVRKPLHETVVAIADALGISLDEFRDPCGGKDAPLPPRGRGRPRKPKPDGE